MGPQGAGEFSESPDVLGTRTLLTYLLELGTASFNNSFSTV